MKIGVIGIGAMGCLFAARLSSLAEIVLIGNWPEQLKALKNGLKIIETSGKETKYRIFATNDISMVRKVDLVLILTKTYQTQRATFQAKKILNDNSFLNVGITLQNGAGNWEELCRELGENRSLVGTTTQAATVMEPGIVRDTGPGSIYLSDFPLIRDKVKVVDNLLTACGWQVKLQKNIHSVIWEKIAINSGINPLTAIFGQTNGEIGQNKITRKLMNTLAKEAVEVATAQGIEISFSHCIEQHMYRISQATAQNQSSMLRDILRGSQTEIDAICGEVIAKGKQANIPTPVTQIFYDLIKKIEMCPSLLME